LWPGLVGALVRAADDETSFSTAMLAVH